MTFTKTIVALAGFALLAGCEAGGHGTVGADKTRDRGTDAKHLSQLVAGIHVDPDGCDHWLIDDGIEGYYMSRLDKYGKPVCSGVASPKMVTGPFKSGSAIADPL